VLSRTAIAGDAVWPSREQVDPNGVFRPPVVALCTAAVRPQLRLEIFLFWFFFIWQGRFSRSRLPHERGDLRPHGEELAVVARSPGVAPLLRGVQRELPAAAPKPT
jgi:hypothetical protein